MICCNTLVRSPGARITSRRMGKNTENQAANQQFVADSDPEFRLNRLTIRADSLANESALAVIESNPL